jgi:hypothetical protein
VRSKAKQGIQLVSVAVAAAAEQLEAPPQMVEEPADRAQIPAQRAQRTKVAAVVVAAIAANKTAALVVAALCLFGLRLRDRTILCTNK